MFEKVTTIITNDKKGFARKARILGGVVFGIAIGVLMNHEGNDVVIIGETVKDDSDFRSSTRSIEDLSDNERDDMDRNTVGEQ